jgi:uncharacterized protein (TIGR00159 family)
MAADIYQYIQDYFTRLTWLDVIDYLLVALLLYQFYKLIRGTPALTIFLGLGAFYLLYLVTEQIGLKVLSRLFGQFVDVGAIALIIVFQQEIRRFLLFIGKAGVTGHRRLLLKLFKAKSVFTTQETEISEIISALQKLSAQKNGALIVITDQPEFKPYEDTGVALHAQLTAELLENIFFKNSPLHDGAVIISGKLVLAARVILPVTEQPNLDGNLGLRHRAAIGISEQADVLVFVVSEQSGELSMAYRGKIFTGITPDFAKKKCKEFKAHKLR